MDGADRSCGLLLMRLLRLLATILAVNARLTGSFRQLQPCPQRPSASFHDLLCGADVGDVGVRRVRRRVGDTDHHGGTVLAVFCSDVVRVRLTQL